MQEQKWRVWNQMTGKWLKKPWYHSWLNSPWLSKTLVHLQLLCFLCVVRWSSFWHLHIPNFRILSWIWLIQSNLIVRCLLLLIRHTWTTKMGKILLKYSIFYSLFSWRKLERICINHQLFWLLEMVDLWDWHFFKDI